MKAIREFYKRFDQMANGRSKEMRLSFDEARDLASAIGQLMTRKLEADEAGKSDEIVISGGDL